MYVEMVVDPDNSGDDLSNLDIHLSLFHYRLEREREQNSVPTASSFHSFTTRPAE